MPRAASPACWSKAAPRRARHFLEEGLVDRIALFRSDLDIGEAGIASPIDEAGIPASFALKRQAAFDNDRYMEWARAI